MRARNRLRRCLLTAFACVFGLLAQRHEVAAQPLAQQTAQEQFRLGVTSLRARQFEAAIEALQRSYDAYPTPVALYNLGLANRELQRPLRAIALFERYLEEGGSRIDPGRIASVREAIEALRLQVVIVRLRVPISQFTTVLDGHNRTHINGELQLDPGDHLLVVSAVGYRPWRCELHVAPGERTDLVVQFRADRQVVAPSVLVAASPDQELRSTPHPPTDQTRTASSDATSVTSRWWFWTGIGAIVVGGVVAGVLIANDDAPTEPLYLPPRTAFSVSTIQVESFH